MNTFFVTVMVAMMLWNGRNTVTLAQKETQSTFHFQGREYTMEELGLPSGSRIKPIRGWYINGYHLIPKEIKHKGAVVVFGGSDGSCDIGNALYLAYHGYEVYAMYYFGQENQRNRLDRIPLEFFAELYIYVQKTAQSHKPLTVHGYSKGTELTLLLASYFPDYVDNIILYAPMSYVFQFYEGFDHSPWTFQGKELPFLAIDAKEGMNKRLIAMRDKKPYRTFEQIQYALEHGNNKEQTRIDLGKIRVKMLIFAGEWDAAYPAADMGREIKANYKGECELVTFEKAGHWFTSANSVGDLMMGGEPEANVQAGIISDRIRLEKLAEWTK